MTDLPVTEDWPLVRLGDVAAINPGKPKYAELSPTDEVGFIPMAAVNEVRGVVTAMESRVLEEVKAKSYRTFATGDVLFAKITPCMENGKVAICPELPNGHGFGSTEFHVLRPGPTLSPQYLWWFLRQESYREEAERHMTGSVGQLRVPVDFLRDTEIALPPIAVQHRIVAHLDEVEVCQRDVRQHVTKASDLISRFRRVLVEAAATGLLTRAWRLNKYGLSDDDEFPVGWSPSRISDVAECLDKFRRPINANERLGRTGPVPYYGADGQVGWIDEALFDEELVLVVEDETFVGRAKPFSYLITGPAWVNNHAHVLRAKPAVIPEMLNILLSYYDFVPLTSGSTGRRKLNQGALMSAELTVPPLEEQVEIARLVREAMGTAEQVADQANRVTRYVHRASQGAVSAALIGGLSQNDVASFTR